MYNAAVSQPSVRQSVNRQLYTVLLLQPFILFCHEPHSDHTYYNGIFDTVAQVGFYLSHLRSPFCFLSQTQPSFSSLIPTASVICVQLVMVYQSNLTFINIEW